MKTNKTIVLLCCLCMAFGAVAQSTTSPYGQYGYGLLNDNATSMQRAMGGVGYAMNSGRQINVMNPASYAAIDSLTFLFDMGGNFALQYAEEGGHREHTYAGGLDYITMSFPLSKRIGASVGVLPFSTTAYTFADSIANGRSARQGSGGISQLYAGLSYNPFANLYVGVNMSYMFGSNTNDLYVVTNSGNTSLFERYMRITDWRMDIGVQYPVRIGQHRVTLGAVFSPGKDLHGETYGLYYDTGSDTKPDTIGFTNLKGKYSLPATYGGGINYMWRDRFMAEVDFTYQPWKDAKYASLEDFEATKLDNRWKVAGGIQYTPAPRGSYMQRVQYRMGGYYNHDYLTVRGNNVREYGVSLGLGFPIPQYKTMINLGVEYKNRRATPNALIKEQYVNITLGINFNEMWFRKSKIY